MSVGEPAESAPRWPRPGRGEARPARRPGPGAVGLPADAPAAARRLAGLAAALLGFVLPVLMVVANKSAPATLAAAALAANAAALLAGLAPALLARYAGLVRAPPTLLALGVVALCVLSFAWTVDPHLTRRGLVEGLPELLFAFALAAAWPLVAGRGDARWLLAGVAAAGLLILFEHLAGMPLHALARARGEAWDLKRSAVPPLLLLWPAAALLWPGRRFGVLAILAAAVGIGIAASHSGAPGAALAAGAALSALALAAPRAALGLTGAGLAALIVAAPWTGSILTRALPPDARQELREEHAEHRLAIWSAFEHRGFDRPWLGHGFDASFAVAEAPRPGGAPAPADSSHIVGFHPHDVMLQFWIEGGALGLAAASVAFCFAMGRLARRRGPPLAARLGLLVAVVGVGLVGLSAWQPWWIASVAAALLWFDHGGRQA
ncbi:O-antigen ligase family protein [Lichenibacterium dinghuense]|uniref:O-antigen ligase family protein n=1 Tax=Lichenibacterium dinghuense TaxID=2895977 RepID=UPI001F2CD409|nr:O-antigen ligase family protein [Lichenibacterium sp. 6Y81]